MNKCYVLDRFSFDHTITQLDDAGLLFQVVERFRNVDLHPDVVSNHEMGTIFEELIRRFNEALNENPGEHFTPRDVVRLMADLLLAGDEDRLSQEGRVLTVYDPCCGSGGMLTITKEQILGDGTPGINPEADIHLFGQEVNPETWAVTKSDMMMVSPAGRDADNIAFGSSLSNDEHPRRAFDYLITNPPYGKDWKRDQNAVKDEHARGLAGRFAPGLPRISDGQTLFLLHMLSHMKPVSDGGSRVAIIMNGSPLFTGDAGSGESEIRRWVLENDWLEAIIALPEQLFYNTGIATYVWVLTNRKAAERAGQVQLIDATTFWTPMRRSLGDKRREIPSEKAAEILRILGDFREEENSKVFPTTHFGFRKITVERPLRLNFQATPERIARLDDERAFQSLAKSKKRQPAEKLAEEEAGRRLQADIKSALSQVTQAQSQARDSFTGLIRAALKGAGIKVPAPVQKAILSALSERDEGAPPCTDRDGSPEPDPELRDTENVPLIDSIEDYFDGEVAPHVPDAWINTAVVDHKDGGVGKVGYEINFSRYFYTYTPPRPLEEIEADILTLEKETEGLLAEILGGGKR